MKGEFLLVQFEELLQSVEQLRSDFEEVGFLFDIDIVKKELDQLEKKTHENDFWQDVENSQKVLQNIKRLKDKIDGYEELYKKWSDLKELILLCIDEKNDEMYTDLNIEYKQISRRLEELKLQTLLSGPYDKNNAILSIHSGAGGTEAQDWVEMLLRMYTRWANTKGFKVETLDLLPGDEAGIKSVTIRIVGENAYGFLKSEKGVHRLVRISPFDAAGRRHTSFAAVEVLPEVEDDTDIIIKDEELEIDTYRASGAGGQHVNKTESAVRIKHIPTGIVVTCQNERSQHKNRETAMKILKAKLFELKEKEQREKMNLIKGEQTDIGWGNQIRSYVFCPYTLVKDHRTNAEVGNVQSVMDGDIDIFINAYLKMYKNEEVM
ncbi:peptide chain release factor 2 [Caldicellulosiruptoraceae bacterium PP1]